MAGILTHTLCSSSSALHLQFVLYLSRLRHCVALQPALSLLQPALSLLQPALSLLLSYISAHQQNESFTFPGTIAAVVGVNLYHC